MIWFKSYTIEDAQKRCSHTIVDHVGIEFLEIGKDYLIGKMPVDHRTKQPEGLLHGGASLVLSETLASVAANFIIDTSKQFCVGLEINANHIRAVREGFVIGKTIPLHIGKTTQVWQTTITQDNALTCTSRMTLSVLNRR